MATATRVGWDSARRPPTTASSLAMVPNMASRPLTLAARAVEFPSDLDHTRARQDSSGTSMHHVLLPLVLCDVLVKHERTDEAEREVQAQSEAGHDEEGDAMDSPALEVVTIVHAHAVTGQRRGQDTERWHEPSCRCSRRPDVTGGYTRQSSRAAPRTRDKQRHHESQEFQRPQVLEVRVLEHVCHIWHGRAR